MCDLLMELDRGPAALAHGCEVTLFSPHSPEDIKACLEETIGARFWNIRLRPVQGNPLRFRELHKVWTLSLSLSLAPPRSLSPSPSFRP